MVRKLSSVVPGQFAWYVEVPTAWRWFHPPPVTPFKALFKCHFPTGTYTKDLFLNCSTHCHLIHCMYADIRVYVCGCACMYVHIFGNQRPTLAVLSIMECIPELGAPWLSQIDWPTWSQSSFLCSKITKHGVTLCFSTVPGIKHRSSCFRSKHYGDFQSSSQLLLFFSLTNITLQQPSSTCLLYLLLPAQVLTPSGCSVLVRENLHC